LLVVTYCGFQSLPQEETHNLDFKKILESRVVKHMPYRCCGQNRIKVMIAKIIILEIFRLCIMLQIQNQIHARDITEGHL